MRHPSILVVPLLAATLTTSCSSAPEDDIDGERSSATATPQVQSEAEASVQRVLERMGATGIGAVESPGSAEAFVYGQMSPEQSVVVHSVAKGVPAPGRRTGTESVGGVKVTLVRTPQFGLVGRFGCGPSTVDLWVRMNDETVSRDRRAVVEHTQAYIVSADCAG